MLKRGILVLSVLAGSVFSAEVDFHGFIKTEVGTDLPVEKFDPSYFAENDLKVVGDVKLNDGVSVEITYRNNSTVGIDRTDLKSIGRNEGGFSTIHLPTDSTIQQTVYDRTVDKNSIPLQVLAKWNFAPKGTILLGDYSYSAGQTNFFRASDSLKYGAIIREQSLRGFGIEASGLTAFVGMVDSIRSSMGLTASYVFPITNKPKTKFTVKPIVDVVLLGKGTESQTVIVDSVLQLKTVAGRNRKWNLGVEGFYSSFYNTIEYSLNGAVGILPYAGENTYSLLLEPTANLGLFTLSSGIYYASLAHSDVAAYRQSDIPEQYFAYVEPSYELHPKVSIGMLYEYHDLSFKAENDVTHIITPAFYIYPNDALEIWAMSGMTFDESFDKAHITMSIKSALRF